MFVALGGRIKIYLRKCISVASSSGSTIPWLTIEHASEEQRTRVAYIKIKSWKLAVDELHGSLPPCCSICTLQNLVLLLYLCFLPTSLTTVHILNIQQIKFIFDFTSPPQPLQESCLCWSGALRICLGVASLSSSMHQCWNHCQFSLASFPVLPRLLFFDHLLYVFAYCMQVMKN